MKTESLVAQLETLTREHSASVHTLLLERDHELQRVRDLVSAHYAARVRCEEQKEYEQKQGILLEALDESSSALRARATLYQLVTSGTFDSDLLADLRSFKAEDLSHARSEQTELARCYKDDLALVDFVFDATGYLKTIPAERAAIIERFRNDSPEALVNPFNASLARVERKLYLERILSTLDTIPDFDALLTSAGHLEQQAPLVVGYYHNQDEDVLSFVVPAHPEDETVLHTDLLALVSATVGSDSWHALGDKGYFSTTVPYLDDDQISDLATALSRSNLCADAHLKPVLVPAAELFTQRPEDLSSVRLPDLAAQVTSEPEIPNLQEETSASYHEKIYATLKSLDSDYAQAFDDARNTYVPASRVLRELNLKKEIDIEENIQSTPARLRANEQGEYNLGDVISYKRWCFSKHKKVKDPFYAAEALLSAKEMYHLLYMNYSGGDFFTTLGKPYQKDGLWRSTFGEGCLRNLANPNTNLGALMEGIDYKIRRVEVPNPSLQAGINVRFPFSEYERLLQFPDEHFVKARIGLARTFR